MWKGVDNHATGRFVGTSDTLLFTTAFQVRTIPLTFTSLRVSKHVDITHFSLSKTNQSRSFYLRKIIITIIKPGLNSINNYKIVAVNKEKYKLTCRVPLPLGVQKMIDRLTAHWNLEHTTLFRKSIGFYQFCPL